jgi:hypothetical protein
MAITIKSAPQASGFVSANEEVWHVVDSTNKDITGFKYIFDLYKSGNLLTRITNSPYGDDDYGVINVGNIVRSTVAVDTLGDLDMSTAYSGSYGVIDAGTDYWWGEYVVSYGEVCGVTTAGDPVILEDLVSGTYRVYNTYNRHEMHKAGAALSSGTVFLTNRPDDSYFYSGQPVVLSINGKRITGGQSLLVKVDGSTRTITAADAMHYFSLNSLSSDSTVSIETTGAVLASKTLKQKCSKYTPYTLVFLNAYGAWDSFTFVNGNVLTDNEKKRFEQMDWKLSGFNMVNKSGKVRYEGMRTYGSEFKTKMKLTTDILNTEEYKWLFELIVSPLVYLWDKDNSLFHPVQITDTNYEIKNSLQNKTETLDVNIDVYKQNTQYR